MPVEGEIFLKIDSSNMQKQRKVAHHRRRNFLKYGTLQIQESVFPSWEFNLSLKN